MITKNKIIKKPKIKKMAKTVSKKSSDISPTIKKELKKRLNTNPKYFISEKELFK